jgi:O-methyltransferase
LIESSGGMLPKARLKRIYKSLRIGFGRGRLDYAEDGLVNKNLSSLLDQKFEAAYQIGIESGHGFGKQIEDFGIRYRVAIAIWCARQALKLDGDFVECGVNTGILSLSICNYLDFRKINKKFYLFDTYEGIPKEAVTSTESSQYQGRNSMYSECFDLAKSNFAGFPNAVLVKGVVPFTLLTVNIEKISYLSIDMNVAKPEIEAITHFWPRLSPGGVVLLDDYGFRHYEEQHAAMNNFAESVNTPILTLPTGQGLIIKSAKL